MEQQHSQLRMLGITPISWPDDAPDLNITPALAGSALLHCSSILPPPLLRHASDSANGASVHSQRSALAKSAYRASSGVRRLATSETLETGDVDTTPAASMLALSEEILLMIFERLTRKDRIICAQVCRQWRRVAYDSSLWREIRLYNRSLDYFQLQSIVSRQPQTLMLTNCTVKSRVIHSVLDLPQPLGELRYLHSLDLSGVACEASVIYSILSNSSALRQLDVSQTALQDEITAAMIARYCNNLESFGARMAQGLGEKTLESLMRNCPRLHTLVLGWVPLQEGALQRIAPLTSRLRALDISGQRSRLTDECMLSLAQHAVNLMVLDISDCEALTDKSLEALSKHCQRLESVAFSRCHLMTGLGVRTLVSVPTLKSMDFFGCYADFFTQLQKSTTVLLNQHPLALIHVFPR